MGFHSDLRDRPLFENFSFFYYFQFSFGVNFGVPPEKKGKLKKKHDKLGFLAELRLTPPPLLT